MNKKTNIYCGIEGSICNKKYRFQNHSLCCKECDEKCPNCTISSNNCIYKKTKDEIKTIIINDYKKEREELEKLILELDRKITDIENS